MKKRRIPDHLRLVKPEVFELSEDITPEGVRAAYIMRFGARCAAWLIRDLDRRRKRRRASFDGSFSMHLEAGEEEPTWFQIAIGFLKARRAWTVTVERNRGRRTFRLRFSGPTPKERGLPVALRIVKSP